MVVCFAGGVNNLNKKIGRGEEEWVRRATIGTCEGAFATAFKRSLASS